jgi:hypothetical protein
MKILLLILALAGMSFAQGHSATLTWTDNLNPSGTTYNIYRTLGACSATTVFSSPIISGLLVKTFVDTTVTTGVYCYAVTAVFNMVQSMISTTTGTDYVTGTIPSSAPTMVTLTAIN